VGVQCGNWPLPPRPPQASRKMAIWLASRAERPAARELAAAVDARAAAASPRSSSACPGGMGEGNPGSAAMARIKRLIRRMHVSFASHPSA